MPFYTSLVVGVAAAYALYKTFFAGNQNDPPPPVPPPYRPQPSYEYHPPAPAPAPVHRRDEWQHRVNIDPFEPQNDLNYPPVETSASLRARAKEEGILQEKCIEQSREAYQRRDHARAKTFSEEGKRHARKMERLNAKASAIIFRENNQDRDACEVDLHGLYVKEAIAYSEKAIAKACKRGFSEIRLIVGQGNHSDGGISRLKPAVQKDMRKRGLHVEVDPKNPGVLIVGGW